MAIFSLNHGFVGRSTSAPGTASGYARYMTKSEACVKVASERMPDDPRSMMKWLDEQENGDRKNARVIDKVIVALPHELTPSQNHELLRDYCERMTEGRASWAYAVHDKFGNFHAHIIFRDRDVETGRRVMMTTEKGSTERFREAWEQEVNIALQREGYDERIDRRSLKEQGIDREAQIHVGPGAEKLAEKQHDFRSSAVEVTRLIDGERSIVTINYPVIDQGKTRAEENEARKLRNAERAALRELEIEEYMGQGGLDMHWHDRARGWGLEKDAMLERAMDRVFASEKEFSRLYQFMAATGDADSVSGGHVELAVMAAEHFNSQTGREELNDWRSAMFGEDPADPTEGSDPGLRGPRRDAVDAMGGVGLAVLGKIADWVESLMDGPSGSRGEKEQHMADESKATRAADVQRQEQAQAEAVNWKKAELDAYLQQRDRERHHDRGR